ncbi:hypothetical protein K9M74_02100 [Candidatus Woesearchaeota archaeon]|nr:hypothetical protein [Candidatus Woesearchaeota archaeon]
MINKELSDITNQEFRKDIPDIVTKKEVEKQVDDFLNFKTHRKEKKEYKPQSFDSNCTNVRLAYGRIKTKADADKEVETFINFLPKQESESVIHYTLRQLKKTYNNTKNKIKQYNAGK